MAALASLLGVTTRETALLVIAAPFWVIGGFFAVMNWIILRYNRIQARQETGRWSSMGPTFGIFLSVGCLIFPPLRIHAVWVWLLDPSSFIAIASLGFWIRERFMNHA